MKLLNALLIAGGGFMMVTGGEGYAAIAEGTTFISQPYTNSGAGTQEKIRAQIVRYLRDSRGWYVEQKDCAAPGGKISSLCGPAFDYSLNYAFGPDLPATVANECGGVPANPKFATSGLFRGTGRGDLMKGVDPNGSYAFLGLGGPDILCGSAGPSTLNGGPGNDVLIGGPGNDNLVGLQGQDILEGGPGADFLDGEPGAGASALNDTLVGGTYVSGYQGPDGVGGKRPNYTVYRFSGTGNTGNDIIRNFRVGDVIELVGRDTNQDGVVDPYDLVGPDQANYTDSIYYSDGGQKLRLTVKFAAVPPACKRPYVYLGSDYCPSTYAGLDAYQLGIFDYWEGFAPARGVIPIPDAGTITFVWDKASTATDWKYIAAHIRYVQSR